MPILRPARAQARSIRASARPMHVGHLWIQGIHASSGGPATSIVGAGFASTSGRREGVHDGTAVAGLVRRNGLGTDRGNDVIPATAPSSDMRCKLPEFVSRLMDPSITPDLPDVLAELGPQHNASLDRIMTAMSKHRATWKRSVLLFDWLVEQGHEVDERLCGTIIRLCTSRGKWGKALEVYKWMRQNDIPCSVFTYTSVMKAALVGHEFEFVLEVFKQARAAIPKEKLDSHIHTLVIEALDRKGDVDRALKVFYDIQDDASSVSGMPSVQLYTATIKAATNAGKVDQAVEIWKDMKTKGIKPSGHAYASIIHAYGTAGDWKEAVRKFDEMVNGGVRADVVSCTALVDALATNGAYARAEKFMEWMVRRKIYPNVRTYSILIGAYVQHAEFARASKLFDQMHGGLFGPKNRPNEFTFSLLIKRLGEKGKWKEAESIFLFLQREILEDKALRDDAVKASRDANGNLDCQSSKHRSYSGRYPPRLNAVICSSMMYAYERSGQWEKAVEFLSVSDALGYQDNIVIRNIAISALAKAGQMAKAEELFEGLLAPDGISFETMVAGYGLAGQCAEAMSFMKGMLAAGYTPNDYSYCALIAGHSRNGAFNDALEAFSRAREAGISSVHLYNAMIASCDRFYKYDKAVQLLEEMQMNGVERNGVTKQLAIGIGSNGVATVQSQQEAILALTAITAAAGGALMRLGVF